MKESAVVEDRRNSMSTQRSTLVAVFHDRAMAEQAIERLQETGFQNDRLYYSGGNTRAGVLSAIKNLYTGEDYPTSNSLVGDLENMGIPGEEAEYYVREHQAGHPIVAIDAGEHVREAEEILKQNGVYRYDLNSGASSIAARQTQEMPSNEELQGIGDYTSQAGYAQPSDLSQEDEDEYDDNPSGEGEHTSGYLRTDNALRGVESTQSPMRADSDSTQQNRVNQKAFDTEATSGSGQAPDYTQDRTLGDAASYYPPSSSGQQAEQKQADESGQ
jgi:hypothetical protein